MTAHEDSTPDPLVPDEPVLDGDVEEAPDTPEDAAPDAEPSGAPGSPDADGAAAADEEPVAEEPADEEPAAEDPAGDAAEPAEAVQTEAESAASEESAVEVTESAPDVAGEPWGRVDDDGTVYVREADGWREVGQFPDGTADEALAYFARKFTDLADKVTLLEQRHRRGGVSAADLRSAAARLSTDVAGAAAVGDLGSLSARISALTGELGAASAAEAAAAREAVDEALRRRTALVEQIEALAARDPKTLQWKQTSAEVSELFDQWQSQQQNGPRLPKTPSQQLWKRFRDARAALDRHRREFYAELDEAHRGVRDRKTRLVERAEALVSKGEEGITAYRALLDEWKTAGRAGKKADDALWARFKAAGDALYGARAERDAAESEASREKIEQRRLLLQEAGAVPDERDLAKARALLTGIQRRWDEVGRIFPREQERALDDDLRKVEQALRAREDADWKRNNPETKARANDMTRQLTDAIEKLEVELVAAKQAGDKKAVSAAEEALSARKAWLAALGG